MLIFVLELYEIKSFFRDAKLCFDTSRGLKGLLVELWTNPRSAVLRKSPLYAVPQPRRRMPIYSQASTGGQFVEQNYKQ